METLKFCRNIESYTSDALQIRKQEEREIEEKDKRITILSSPSILDRMTKELEDFRCQKLKAQPLIKYQINTEKKLKMKAFLPDYRVTTMKECRSVECFEMMGEIDEGTFGTVFRAKERCTGRLVALKRVKMNSEFGLLGYPMSSIREISTMFELRHPNIVTLFEIVVGSTMHKVYIVLEFMDHDLKSLMENMGQQYFTISVVKNILIQLLSGVAYLHNNWILHRDIKTSNILYNNKGEIKLCDFGLARQYGDSLQHYTCTVITPYYRPPELFLGVEKYSTEVDIWSCGCVFSELITKEPLFMGKGELEIITKIFSILGTPTEKTWPEWTKLRNYKTFKYPPHTTCRLNDKFPCRYFDSRPVLSNCGLTLLEQFLCLNPALRISAQKAQTHLWFLESPAPKSNDMMPTFPSTATLDVKKRYQVRYADPLERITLLQG